MLSFGLSGYSIIKELPNLNRLSASEKIDWLGNLASFSSPTAALAAPIAKGYTGLILNALNYNPAGNL